jgi:hypothetical protein
MTCTLRYYIPVKSPVQRSIPALPALLGILLFPLLLVSLSAAQHDSASQSSSSSGHTSSGSNPSTMSVGHTGYAPANSGGVTFSTSHSHSSNGPGVNHTHPHHRAGDGNSYYYPYLYAVPFPYAVDASDTAASTDADDDDDEYQGGPTIFDRRGSGAASYVPPTYDGPAHAQAPGAGPADPSSPEPPIPTTLVFRDGHQLEIENYAIVSQTLYDLTPGHPRKIALADLDLPATERQNDDRGVTFQLPPSAQAN